MGEMVGNATLYLLCGHYKNLNDPEYVGLFTLDLEGLRFELKQTWPWDERLHRNHGLCVSCHGRTGVLCCTQFKNSMQLWYMQGETGGDVGGENLAKGVDKDFSSTNKTAPFKQIALDSLPTPLARFSPPTSPPISPCIYHSCMLFLNCVQHNTPVRPWQETNKPWFLCSCSSHGQVCFNSNLNLNSKSKVNRLTYSGSFKFL
ncbi:uncharacterized protein LOC112346530 [Selaginella moellendorffii]|uniref:uncharacterized protein LOC112346530 n=1 Tax=Selaginella moellendorffii TaxID=88036 RepID=UPI000D1C928D|nr:uncharacterized protein LOC112346530 [Selaginella moellendorffii]|eukprot:XP_024531454.1 uncharacterized protein LOC112346530 [Selaginella moellendorffii]